MTQQPLAQTALPEQKQTFHVRTQPTKSPRSGSASHKGGHTCGECSLPLPSHELKLAGEPDERINTVAVRADDQQRRLRETVA